MRFLILLALAIEYACCSCPTGFELVNGQECRGRYTSTQGIAWKEVVTECSEILGNPIIIHSQEDQNYWAGRLKNSPNWNVLGFVCNATSQEWEWADGTPLDYKPNGMHDYLDGACSYDSVGAIRNYDGFWSYVGSGDDRATDVFCSTPLRQPLPSSDGCDGFDDDSDDGVCYQIGAASKNWRNAQLTCSSFGATVASIHNDKENSFIRRLAVSKKATGGLFLGATASGKKNKFEWIDGSTWDYNKFYPGFPAAGLGDCLMMDTAVATGDWANVDCATELSVACQRPRNFTNPCTTGPWYEGQIIFSPGFPFDASISCDYILSVDAGKKVELEVVLLEANPCCDSMIIYENYFGTNIIANLTGIINGATYTTSSSNYMRVSWQPNGGVNVRGMMITFRGV